MKVVGCKIDVTATFDLDDDPDGGLSMDGLSVNVTPEPGFEFLAQQMPTLAAWLRQVANQMDGDA